MADLLPSTPDVSAAEESDPRVVGVDSDDADDLIGALSSATARQLLAALHEEPANPAKLADEVDTTIQNAQYHLEKLEAAGLIEVIDTAYSEKGREMQVYAPSDRPLVVVAGGEEETTGLRAAISRLLGALGVLGLSSLLVEQLVGQGVLPFGADGGTDGGDAGGAPDGGDGAPPAGGGDDSDGAGGDGDGGGAGGDGGDSGAGGDGAGGDGAGGDGGDVGAFDQTDTLTERAADGAANNATGTPAGAVETPAKTGTATAEPAGTPAPTGTPAPESTGTPSPAPQGTPTREAADTVTLTGDPATPTRTPVELVTETAAGTPAPEPLAGLPPGLLFFAGGATVLIAGFALWYLRQ